MIHFDNKTHTKLFIGFLLLLLISCADVTGIRFINNPVMVGDSVDQVIAKWGYPNAGSRTRTTSDRYDVAVYKCMRLVYPRYYFLPCYYVYFENGIVSAIERIY